MAFCVRVFCRAAVLPTVTEMLLGLRQEGVTLGVTAEGDVEQLVTPFWREALLGVASTDETFVARQLGPEAGTGAALRDELDDFLTDLGDLAPSAGRERVTAFLRETRAVVQLAYPPEGLSVEAEAAVDELADLLEARADGLIQRDGAGFFDDEGELLLALG